MIGISNSLHRSAAVALAAVVGLAVGCGSSGTFIPVTGTITIDGKALPDAEVVFVPDTSKGTKGDNASGFTDAQGNFTLRTGRTGKEGVAPGFYRVVITDSAGVADLTTAGELPAGEGVGSPPKATGPKRPRLPAVYSDPSQTPLRDVEVKADNPPVNFDIKSSQR